MEPGMDCNGKRKRIRWELQWFKYKKTRTSAGALAQENLLPSWQGYWNHEFPSSCSEPQRHKTASLRWAFRSIPSNPFNVVRKRWDLKRLRICPSAEWDKQGLEMVCWSHFSLPPSHRPLDGLHKWSHHAHSLLFSICVTGGYQYLDDHLCSRACHPF